MSEQFIFNRDGSVSCQTHGHLLVTGTGESSGIGWHCKVCDLHSKLQAAEGRVKELERQLNHYNESYKELCEESCGHEKRAEMLATALRESVEVFRLVPADSRCALDVQRQIRENMAVLALSQPPDRKAGD